MRTITTHLNQAIIAVGLAALLMGCLTDPSGGESATGRITLEVTTPPARLQKGLVPDLTRLEVIMVSSKRDTVRDTITRQGSRLSTEPAWLDGNGGFVHLFARYELKAGRSWALMVRTFDAADTMIHEETMTVEGLQEYEYRAARLEMEPRRLGYAIRVNLPSTTPGKKQGVDFRHVELVVDGVVVRDSLLTSADCRRELVLMIPHLRSGVRNVELRAYGHVVSAKMAASTSSLSPELLLSGAAKVNIALDKAATEESITLSWNTDVTAESDVADPVEDDLKFKIGAVGKVSMNIVIPAAVVL